MNFKKFEKVCKAHGINEFDVYDVTTDGSAVSTFLGQTDKNLTAMKFISVPSKTDKLPTFTLKTMMRANMKILLLALNLWQA